MNIFNHFKNITLTTDQYIALEKLSTFLQNDERVFILQGYAGSGKTTLLKGIIQYLMELQKAFDVMAPTGRAAKILREKTGYGETIHKTIYNFEKLETIRHEDNNEDYSLKYVFPVRQIGVDGKVLIIDEASMVSSVESKNELLEFGTDIPLNDLLTYSRVPHTTTKIIFVGDPAQLPPVGDNASKALLPEYFENLGIKTGSCILKEVVRQKENTILANATKIRTVLETEPKTEISLDYDKDCFVKTKSESFAQQYVERFPVPEIGQGVIIAFSNAQCLEYNRSVRKKIFPQNQFVTEGDLLIINQNNYHTYGIQLMNGDMVKVMAVNQHIISRKNIPVYETINGKRVKKQVNLDFREATIRVENKPVEVKCLIIDSLLNAPGRDLSITEMKALYIDFVMRFQDVQKEKKEKGLPFFKVGSEEFNARLKSDPFYNALRVKYGYAITCHKAQGGEWNTTFIDYLGRTSLENEPLRWAYTATTRAVEECYVANAPNVSVFSKFSMGEIQPLTNLPADALDLSEVPISPFHMEGQHRAKSLKFWEIYEKLENSHFQISNVKSVGPYLERYTFSLNEESGEFDVYHNEAGFFKDFLGVPPNKYSWYGELIELLNQPVNFTYNIKYNPSLDVLDKLYGLMQSVCSTEEATITNIIEYTKNYYVNYFIKTDAKCSMIQFYFNGKEQLTRAMPKSTSGSEDKKLVKIISNLKAHVL